MGVGEGAGTRRPGLGRSRPPPPRPPGPGPSIPGGPRAGRAGPCLGEGVGGAEGVNRPGLDRRAGRGVEVGPSPPRRPGQAAWGPRASFGAADPPEQLRLLSPPGACLRGLGAPRCPRAPKACLLSLIDGAGVADFLVLDPSH